MSTDATLWGPMRRRETPLGTLIVRARLRNGTCIVVDLLGGADPWRVRWPQTMARAVAQHLPVNIYATEGPNEAREAAERLGPEGSKARTALRALSRENRLWLADALDAAANEVDAARAARGLEP